MIASKADSHGFVIAISDLSVRRQNALRGSYLSQDPDWQPSLNTIDPDKTGDDFTMIDMLRFADVA